MINALAPCRRVALLVAACNSNQSATPAPAAAPAGPPPWTLTLKPVDLPAATGSAGIQLTSSDRGVLASWIEYVDDKATLMQRSRTMEHEGPGALMQQMLEGYTKAAPGEAIAKQ